MGKPFLAMALEWVAAAAMIYLSTTPDANLAALAWLVIWKACRAVAEFAGRLGMRAELRYFATVKL
jgi:hypothetical protein